MREGDGQPLRLLVDLTGASLAAATSPALGVVAATAGMAERRNVRVLLGRGAGIVARAASGTRCSDST